MVKVRTIAACAFGLVFAVSGAGAQDLLPSRPLGPARSPAQYRNFELKSDLASVSTAAGLASSSAKMIHERPALLQDLEWKPTRWGTGSSSASPESVEQMVFSFYNDRLYRVVVDYAREKTEGMTDADMVEAVADLYGTPGKRLPASARVASQVETESGSPVARWGDARQTIVLYHTSMYGDAFRLIVTDSDLERLARKASTDAERLDQRNAPQIEIARQQKEREDGRAVAEKARAANKKAFRP
jgi:hypothetical protein